MTMRAQTYEFKNDGVAISAGTQQSIFLPKTGGLTKLNQTIKAETNEFIVIEEIAVTPDVGSAKVQIKLGTTEYFKNPDGTSSHGVPHYAIPYPRSTNYQKIFELYPDVYVLPGQTWDVLVHNRSAIATTDDFRVYVKHTLYDGPDAVIATRLMGMGVSVSPSNVDWLKRLMIERGSTDVSAIGRR